MNKNIIPVIILSIAIILAGASVAIGLNHVAHKDRAVTVKGLSTRDVKADHAVWPLQFTIQGNDLKSIDSQLSGNAKIIRQFLVNKGFAPEDILQGNINVYDKWANYYDHRPDFRYEATSTMVVNTDSVDLVVACQSCQTELLSKGIIVNSNEWSLDYQFNGLTELKPEMIEEATGNARVVAQKFADDAHCRLGSIRHANQGQFSIENDSFQPWKKHVRVVTTISYYLK